MAPAGKWRLLLLFFSPAVLIALLIGLLNLGAFYQLQASYLEDDKTRVEQLREASTLTDFNQRLAQIQLQMEQLLARHATTALSRAELEQVSREIGVRLTALDWEFGNRFTSTGVTSEIYQALDAAEAHRQVMLEALETATTDPDQAKIYFEAATAKQQLLSQASNAIVERVVNDQLTTWQAHNQQFKTSTRNTVLIGGTGIALLLLFWLVLVSRLNRDLFQLAGALQQLAQPQPEPEPEPLTAVEKMAASPAHLMRGMANSVLVFRDAVKARRQAEQELRSIKQDVSRYRQKQETLGRHNEHLEQLVSERTRELKRARAAAEAANHSKSEFLTNVSHDLLTPMNAIISLTHRVSRATEAPQQCLSLEKINSEARHLLDMINNLLDLSRVDASQIESERQDFDLGALVYQVINRVQPQTDEAGLGMVADISQVPHTLYGNSIRLEQVLFNLMDYAVNSTEQGEIKVTAETVARDANRLRVRFQIICTGVGLSEAHKAHLFQAFTNADNAVTRAQGNGLGLAVSKRMVQLMEGEIGVENRPAEGCTVWFELPMCLARSRVALPEDNG